VSYTLATLQPVKPFTSTAEAGGALALGGSDYWAFDGRAGQILRYEALSEQFDVALQLFNPRGEAIGGDDDGASDRNAMLTALLAEPGRYLLRVYAYGGGGAGSYRLRRINDPVRALAINARVEGRVGTGGEEIWSFEGRAGQVLIVSARSSEFDTRVAVYGPDATEVASDDNNGEGTDSLLSVRLPLDGTYTLWVAAQGGGGSYSLRVIEAQ
jgi:serine protease Do